MNKAYHHIVLNCNEHLISNVSQETRERVLRVIEENNYVPSASARALISGKTNTIGVLVMYDLSRFPQDFLPSILEGISSVLAQKGYSTALFFDQVNGKKNAAPQNLLQKGQVDGLLIVSVERDKAVKQRIMQVDVPTVVVNQKIDMPDVGYVVADDFRGMYSATECLIDRGHRRIAFLGGHPSFSTSVDRFNGYERALKDYGIAFDEELCRVADFNNEISYCQSLDLIRRHPDITAIVSANDAMALGAYRAIHELGLQVPDDISVIGFDNQEYCQFMYPPLSTVRKHRRMMGEYAARSIVDTIEGINAPQKMVVQPDLIIRESIRQLD